MDTKRMGQSITQGIRDNPLPVSLIGLALVWLAAEKMKSPEVPRRIHAEEKVTIARPPEELYRYWRDMSHMPRLFATIRSVQSLDATRSHWVAQGPFNMDVEWDAEIFNDIPFEEINWRSLKGSVIETNGTVRFRPAPGNRGTEVHVILSYLVPGERLGAAVSKLIGLNPEAEVREGLRHFKQLMETGEIPTTLNQPSGPASGAVLKKEMHQA